jgi:hypothetical protein
MHSTGARVKAFKAALNGELGDEPFAHPDLAAAMDLCVSCKGCKKNAQRGRHDLIKTEYLAQRNAMARPSRRAAVWRAAALAARGGAPQAPGAPAQCLAVAGGLAERWLGISARRPILEIVADGFTAPALDATGTGAR